jgi:hypothetical protein
MVSQADDRRADTTTTGVCVVGGSWAEGEVSSPRLPRREPGSETVSRLSRAGGGALLDANDGSVLEAARTGGLSRAYLERMIERLMLR